MIGGILRDLTYIARVLGRSRVFTAVAIASMALGIGANTSMYSVIRVLLFDPMPVRSPDELALVYWHDGGGTTRISNISSSGYTDPATGRGYRSNYSYPLYAAIRDLADDDIDIAGFNFVRDLGVSFDDRPAVLAGGLMADGRYFSVLQPGMALGRTLDAADDTLAEPVAVVISYGFWIRAFGGEASTVGRGIRVNGVPALVVGVTARGFRGLSKGGFFPQTDVTLPLRSLPRIMPRWQPDGGSLLTSERHFWVRLLARIAPPAQLGPLEARLSARLAPGLASVLTPGAEPPSIRLLPGGRGLDQVRPETRRLLYVLMGVVGAVLLIACVNLASLMLSRGVARQRELAVRRALGASRARLIRQLVLEGLCLALAGGAAGLLLTIWGRRLLTTLLTAGLGAAPLSTQPLELVVDARLLVWTLIASLGAALACSVLPAFRLTRLSEVADLRHQTAGSPRLRLARSLVAAQIAVSMPLLVGAVLFLQTLANLVRVELGFNPSGLAYFRLDPVATGVPASEHAAIYQSVLARLRAVPGVRSATLMENVFLSGITSNTGVTIDGERRSLYMNAVGPDFTETLGMRLLAGRAPDARDVAGAPRTAAINEAAARFLFGSASPLGRTVDLGGGSSVEVVGVVSDSLYDGRRADVRPIMFDSALQRPGFGGHHLVIRTAVPVVALESDIRQALAGVHRDLPVPEIRTQAAQVGDSIVRERVFTQVLMLFGGFALLLAGLGLHGMTAYAVSRRRSEFGVRVALGARPGQVLWLVLRQVVALATIGLCAGIPLSLAVAPVVSSVLFGVEPTEAWAVATASVAMLAVAIGSGLLPARRAAMMDPLAALRTE